MNTLSAQNLFVLRAVEALQAQGSRVTFSMLRLVVPLEEHIVAKALSTLEQAGYLYSDVAGCIRLTMFGFATVIRRVGLRRPAACDRRQARPFLAKHLAKATAKLCRVA